MLQTTRAIVLRTIRHGDRGLVLKAFTESFGLRSYMVRTGGKGPSRMAALQALSRVELVVTETADRDLHQLREVRVERPYTNLSMDPVRGTVALFVQELLVRVLREESADPALFEFLQEALESLDTAEDLSHFPLLFLVELSRHLGIDPEPPVDEADHFDLREGRFVEASHAHGHVIGPPQSHALAELLRAGPDAHALRIPGPVRRLLLDQLLLYYRMHLEGLGELRSPAVLHQVLG
ncbi:MAG: DNA repair protein RecO [Flavobacteriales bacterium]|nr:DNA repair protein RecO [Flavobacteriales bacterium]MBL0036326.1 DNA repair protein RecO [Flavobacteriales bacterium]